jgi:hypothetical protein
MKKIISFFGDVFKKVKIKFRVIDVRKFNRKTAIIGVLIVVLAAGGLFFGRNYLKPKPKQIYEALIAVRSQSNPDPKEDERNSLKAGDVILVLPEGHKWSETERVSYLILRMNMNEDQARTLVSPQERKAVIPKPKSDEEKKQAEERKKAEGNRQQMETVRARQYRIKLEELDRNFDPNTLLEKQPYMDKIYDWSLVEKKPKL